MHIKARLVMMDVLKVCEGLNGFGEKALINLQQGLPQVLGEDEQQLFLSSIDLLRKTADNVRPLISPRLDDISLAAKIPALHLA
jgi:hypothetical protein